jgi:hypothetical protein
VTRPIQSCVPGEGKAVIDSLLREFLPHIPRKWLSRNTVDQIRKALLCKQAVGLGGLEEKLQDIRITARKFLSPGPEELDHTLMNESITRSILLDKACADHHNSMIEVALLLF